MKANARYLQIALILVFLFCVFTYIVHLDIFTKFDFDTTVILQDNISDSVNTALSSLSLIGSVEIVGSLLLLLLYLFKKMKSFIVFFLFALLHVPELFAKTFLEHPGPAFMFHKYDIGFVFPSSHVSPGFSYPSGHAARAIFISIILAFLFSRLKLEKNKKYVIYGLILVFDVAMLVSRVYLGEHWTSDVMGGILLGAAFAVLSLAFL